MRQRALWLQTVILAIAFVLMLSWQSGSALPARQTKPAGFEYKMVHVLNGYPDEGGAFLDEFDRQGWELIAIQPLITSSVGGHVYTKRSAQFKVLNWDDHGKASAIYVFRRSKAAGK
jgi:hypothetical protein